MKRTDESPPIPETSDDTIMSGERRSILRAGVVLAGGATAALTLSEPAYAAAGTGCINVQDDFSATGDGVTDDTTAVQNALDAANGTGQVVYFPPGAYLIQGTLEAYGCKLQGAGTFGHYDHSGVGSVILAKTVVKLIKVGAGTTIEDLVFFYHEDIQPPNPQSGQPTVCDYTIYADDTLGNNPGKRMIRIFNNWFVNCYNIAYLGIGWSEFIQNKCTVINLGIACEAIGVEQIIADNHFSYGIWFQSVNGSIRTWIEENGCGIYINDAHPKISRNFFFALDRAVHISGPWGQGRFVENGIDGCRYGLLIDGQALVGRLPVSNNTFLIRRKTDDSLVSHAILVQHTEGEVKLQVTGNHIGGVNGDCIYINNSDQTDGPCNLGCEGNEFYSPGRYLTTSFARYAIKFNSPNGTLTANGNLVQQAVYPNPGGFRVYNAKTANISHNTFMGMAARSVQVDSAIYAVVIGNISIDQSGTAFAAATVTTLVEEHNIWGP